jgi:ferrous-iron efflux pump FieF
VIAALVFDRLFEMPILDALIGGTIGTWIIYSSVGLFRLSLTQLMDRELPDEERRRIRQIAEANNEVTAVHDLRTRVAGPTAFIQLHLEMDGGMPLLQAHQIADAVEAQLREAYPNAEIIIHQDPAGLEEPHQTFLPRVPAG